MTNILYIIEELELGGAERVVIDLARSLDRGRYSAKVCCLRQKGDFAFVLEDEGIEVIELGKKPGIDFLIIPKLIRVIKDNKIALVHTHLWVANFWGRLAAILARVPVIITEHNVDVWKKWPHKMADRLLAPFTKKICVVSEQVKRFYREEVGIAAGKLEVVYNGIESLQGRAPDAEIEKLRNELKLTEDIPAVVNISRLVAAKANHLFIEAVRVLDRRNISFKAFIIGDGPLKATLVAQGQDLIDRGKLVFTGMRKDVSTILDITAVSALSSTREGLSVVVLEAMAKGIPFVATDVGGNPEQIIDGETGFLVPANNAEALAEAISRILQDPDLARKMSEQAVRRVSEHFSLERMVKRMEEIYGEFINV
ncbi:MAG: glycosyltransferase [Candidatus Omnitrophota bacterium]